MHSDDSDAGLTPSDIRLSDGRLVRLGPPDPIRDRRADLLVLRSRLHQGGQAELATIVLWRTLLSIEAINAEVVTWPAPTKVALERYRGSFSKPDLYALVERYAEIYQDIEVAPPLVPARYRPRDVRDGRRR